jgi:hypothetical protein
MRGTKLQKLLWSRFDQRRTREAGGQADFLLRSSVSLSIPAGSSHREDVEQIARMASLPFSIVSISKVLDERKSLRGVVYFGEAGSQIDKILHNYPGVLWWMEKDGLVIDVAPPHSANRLSEFDRTAGKLVCDATRHGKLSTDTVEKIAAGLDAAGFTLSLKICSPPNGSQSPIIIGNTQNRRLRPLQRRFPIQSLYVPYAAAFMLPAIVIKRPMAPLFLDPAVFRNCPFNRGGQLSLNSSSLHKH